MGRIQDEIVVKVNYGTGGQKVLALLQKAARHANMEQVSIPREQMIVDAIDKDTTSTKIKTAKLLFALYFTDIEDRKCLEKQRYNGKTHLDLLKQQRPVAETLGVLATYDFGMCFAVEELLPTKHARPATLREMIYYLVAQMDAIEWHPVVALGTQLSTDSGPQVASIIYTLEPLLDLTSKHTAHYGISVRRRRPLVSSGFLVVLDH